MPGGAAVRLGQRGPVEATGIPPEALDLLDDAVAIPMTGTGSSLDVAVAGSLVLYRLAGLP
jgi:tRNA (guanosine-2'-O-)-methyltransferase